MSVPGSNFSTVDELVNPFRALIVTLKTDYADSDTTRKRKNRYRENLRDEAVDAFDDVLEPLKAGVTMWQFFKALTLQQELAMVSRRLIYTYIPHGSCDVLPLLPPRTCRPRLLRHTCHWWCFIRVPCRLVRNTPVLGGPTTAATTGGDGNQRVLK